MVVIGLIFYSLGMIVADKILANAFVEGMEKQYEELLGTEYYVNEKVMYCYMEILNILAKILIPLLWPIMWTGAIILVIRTKKT